MKVRQQWIQSASDHAHCPRFGQLRPFQIKMLNTVDQNPDNRDSVLHQWEGRSAINSRMSLSAILSFKSGSHGESSVELIDTMITLCLFLRHIHCFVVEASFARLDSITSLRRSFRRRPSTTIVGGSGRVIFLPLAAISREASCLLPSALGGGRVIALVIIHDWIGQTGT